MTTARRTVVVPAESRTATGPATFTHATDAVLDYVFDFARNLGTGETIHTHTVTVTAGVATIDHATRTDTTVTAWVSSATTRLVDVTCRVATTDGRSHDHTITLIRRTNR